MESVLNRLSSILLLSKQQNIFIRYLSSNSRSNLEILLNYISLLLTHWSLKLLKHSLLLPIID